MILRLREEFRLRIKKSAVKNNTIKVGHLYSRLYKKAMKRGRRSKSSTSIKSEVCDVNMSRIDLYYY